MPTSPPSSTDSSPPSAREPRRLLPLGLFLATLVSVFWVGSQQGFDAVPTLRQTLTGWRFAVPLLAILLAHEFGHYFAAKAHGVRASLPYFVPMPFSIFGTMGAIIGMPDRITTRRALLDIGAAGPIAGLVLALPILAWGLAHSDVHALDTSPNSLIEGQSLLYWLMKRVFVGPIAPGDDVYLHPTAFAGWVGLFITMLNLIPVGQTDGGHIAYALLGPRQDKIAKWIHLALLPLVAFNFLSATLVQRAAGFPPDWVGKAVSFSSLWLVWFVLLHGLKRVTGGNHPPVDDDVALDPVRRAIAVGSLVLFVLLFVRAPFTIT